MDKKGSFFMTAKFEVRPREPTAPHIANYWQWSSLLKPSGIFYGGGSLLSALTMHLYAGSKFLKNLKVWWLGGCPF